MSIPENLADILARLSAARKAAILPAPAIHLIAISKTVDESGIRAALGDTLIWSGEDDPADSILPRFLKASMT